MPASRFVLVALLASLVLPACGSGASSPPVCTTPTTATTVQLKDFSFEPTCVQAATGAALTLDNSGSAEHSFTVKETGINVDVNAGATGTASLDGIAAGTYTVVCTFHPQMVGALRVT
jgi:plastocyanin